MLPGCTKQSVSTKKQKSHEQKDTVQSIDFNHAISAVFGPSGMQVDGNHLKNLHLVTKELCQLSELDTARLAALVAQQLPEDQEPISVYVFLKKYYAQKAGKFENKKITNPHLINLAEQIIQFLQFEQTHIFNAPHSINSYIQLIEKHQLPDLINPWRSQESLSIINHLHTYTPPTSDEVQVQGFLIEAASMLAQTAVMASSSIANKALSELQDDVSTQLQHAITTTQTEAKTAREQASKTMQTTYKQDMQAFGKAVQNINSEQNNYSKLAQQEADYVTQGLSIQQEAPQNLFNAVSFDQIFTASPMRTPNSYLTWRNPFPVGDWHYDPIRKSFIQRNLVNLLQQSTDAQGNITNSSALAQNNSIFAEYFTVQPTYTIAGTITVYAVSYPFFVGIIFNKQRWISGNSTSLFSSRLVGLWGQEQENQTTGATEQTCQLYYAEQHNLTDEQLKQALAENPHAQAFQSPLYQISNQLLQPVAQLDGTFLNNLVQMPVTFNFEITTSKDTCELFFWNAKDPQPKKPYLVQNIQEQLFICHSIGFTSPGAITEFTITSPQDAWFAITTEQKE